MTKSYALNWVGSRHPDPKVDPIDPDELLEAFVAIYGRQPTEDDLTIGLWRLCCEAERAEYHA